MSLGENLSPLYQVNGGNMSLKGDFLGFTIGNIHSSALGIVRVSDSDRYNEDLTPTFTDKTVVVSGLDETYYFGADYTQKTFTIKFAFDHLLDSKLRQLKQIFSKKEPQDLIFDEMPYKVYSVKCSGTPRLNYLCFDEDYIINNTTRTRRVYKGDGTVNFVAYSPFARSRFKYLDDYIAANIPEWKANNDDNVGILSNKEEWKDSSGIISPGDSELSLYNIDICQNVGSPTNKYRFLLHNPGDLESKGKILLKFNDGDSNEIKISLVKLQAGNYYNEIKELTIDISKLSSNYSIGTSIYGVVIDNKTKLIHPLTASFTIKGNDRGDNNSTLWTYDNTVILNYIISAGDFFTIPVCNYSDYYYIQVNKLNKIAVDYKYLYY